MMKNKTALLFISMVSLAYSVTAQINCSTLDLNKVPGKWVFKKGGYGNQWQICEPIRKELQRMMPVALDGLYATNSIAFGDKGVFEYTKSPDAYECYLMLKDFQCVSGNNELKPEGETGCWIYFSVNDLEGEKFPLPAQVPNIIFNESTIRVTNIGVQTDAAGNKIIYSSYRPDEVIKHCYYFSARNGLPWRKMTNNELFAVYKTHHEKQANEQIAKFEKLLAEDEKKYRSLSTAEKQQQSYWPDIIKKDKERLQSYKTIKEKVISWYSSVIKQDNLNDTAYVTAINGYDFYPEKLKAASGNGYHVWVDNLEFFDKAKPKEIPQCIAVYTRRQDNDLPKKNFMDLFYNAFNVDVLAKMVGETAKKPNGMNTLSASLNDAKSESITNQTNVSVYSYNFDAASVNQFPKGWNGMKNITVQQYENKNWLAINKDGYCYPQQFNKAIDNNFNLSFDLSWNKDIAYNSGLFTVSFSEIPYDNAGERYKMDDNQEQYWSFYDSYVGNFNRVMIWFDPYWNGGGTLEVYSYDKNETVGVKKRIVLPEFYMAKNSHQIKMQRKGNSLLVFINNKKEAAIENVFIPSAKYNLYTFSRYKGNGSYNKKDVFYLDNIKTSY